MNPELSRRGFLKRTVLATGGFMLSRAVRVQAASPGATGPVALNAWISVTPDNWVTLMVSQAEIGQGIETTLTAVIADELGADWARVRRQNAPVAVAFQNPVYHWQFTGNAESTRTFHRPLRTLAAAARQMLTGAAAVQWGLATDAGLRTQDSFVIHDASGRRIAFGDIAGEAARRQPPARPTAKKRGEWKLVGRHSLPRVDVPAKVRGTAVFGMDVVVPGMLHGAVAYPRAIGARLARVDPKSVLGLPGVKAVVPAGEAVIVVADRYWQAAAAVRRLDVGWTEPPAGRFNSAALDNQYAEAFSTAPFEKVVAEGPPPPPAESGRTLEAEYRSGWQAHAPMEPMNCTASVSENQCTLWAPTQGQGMCQLVVAATLGIPKENVAVNRTYIGGGFGRRLVADYAVLAALASRAAGRPVKVIWTREMEFHRSMYRPAFVQRVKAQVAADGMPAAVHCRLVAPTILTPVSPGPFANPRIDPLCVEALNEVPYGFGAFRLDYHMLQVPVPTMVWRTTGAGPNLFFLESLVDELAHLSGADPYLYRRELLARRPGNERLIGVLDLVVGRSGFSGPAAPGIFRGIACGKGFGSYLAQVVEIAVPAENVIDVRRVVSAVDCGQVLDPRIAAGNIEGGIVWGLSQAFSSELTFADGGVAESNYDGYRILTLPETPVSETYFLDGGADPGGIGEVGPLCVPPALANAIFAATGRRLRSLPLARHGIISRGRQLLS